ncbi:MAG: 3-dehydroquinate synthase [Lachnospiraceae bacterium]|jgi:3-dehydroquinate synthase
MADRLTVHDVHTRPIYDIVIEETFDRLKEEMLALKSDTRKLCVVSDSNVAALYGKQVQEILAGCSRKTELFVFPAGEEHKNLTTVRDLYEFLIQKKFDRSDMLVALGGGVTGDLCGFAAATYLRGIPFVQIPTTLLSQVDSSIGGKTGVDFDSYKNMVGAFHMPSLVYTNLSTLKTLNAEQFASGMGEIIKHGLIKNADYCKWLSEHAERIQNRDLDACRIMILESNRIKRDVVEKDPKEQGERALLNFGHTLGHAIEKLKDFTMLHGQCVAVGSIAACEISALRGQITRDEADWVRELFCRFGLPDTVTGLDAGEVIEASRHDKKMEQGTIKFILLRGIGNAETDRTVTEQEMRQGLEAVLR